MRTTSALAFLAGLAAFCSTAAGLPVGYDWHEYNGRYYALTETCGDSGDGGERLTATSEVRSQN